MTHTHPWGNRIRARIDFWIQEKKSDFETKKNYKKKAPTYHISVDVWNRMMSGKYIILYQKSKIRILDFLVFVSLSKSATESENILIR